MDKMGVSGTFDLGSIPSGATSLKNIFTDSRRIFSKFISH